MAVQGGSTSYAKPRVPSPVARALAPFAGTPSDASSTGGYGPGTPVPPPVAPDPYTGDSSGGGGGGGAASLDSNPFQTDPGYLAALAAQQAGAQQLDNALKAARESAIVQFGDPGLAQLAGFNLDPVTAAMAQANTQAGNSTLAQLQKQRDSNQQTIQNTLAAHGIIRSGDLGYRTGQNQQAYGTELYNAQQGVLGNLNQQLQQNLAAKQGLQGDTVKALTSAYQTYVQNPAFWGAADIAGQTGAANANAAETAAPVTQALSRPSAPRQPVSRLATPAPGPSGFRTARQVAMG